MSKSDHRITHFVVGCFLSGVALLAIAQLWEPSHESRLLVTVHHLMRESGFAFMVGGLVATIFEQFLSGERDRRLKGLMRDFQKMEDAGFHEIFVDRQNVFDRLINVSLPEATHVQIVGICISLFREFQRQYKRPYDFQPIEYVSQQILRGQRIEALMLKRAPSADEMKQYGLQAGDFYQMREYDEDKEEAFDRGRRLRKIANQAVGQWIEVLVRIAERSCDVSTEERREALQRLRLKEYLALPSLSLYILDEDIFVTPYLYKRHCSSVPAFAVKGRTTPLYKAYHAHFAEIWKSRLTTDVIPHAFVEALTRDPRNTASNYRQRLTETRESDQLMLKEDPEYGTSPEYFRAEERAMLSVAAQP